MLHHSNQQPRPSSSRPWLCRTIRSGLLALFLIAGDGLQAQVGPDPPSSIPALALQRLPRPYRDEVIIRTFADETLSVSSGEAVTLVIGDSRTSSVYMGITGNCRAESDRREIRCDLSLVDDLISEFQLGDGEEIKAELLAIIIAHELGHVILGHGGAAYHGDGSSLSVLSYAQHRTELEADAFAVELLDRTPNPIGGVYRLIENLARSAQHSSLCPDVFPAPCPCTEPNSFAACTTLPMGPGLPSPNGAKVKVTLKGTHPAYVVRFIRMLSLSAAPRMRDVYSKDAMFELSNMVVQDETGTAQGMEPLLRETPSQQAARRSIKSIVRDKITRAQHRTGGRAGTSQTEPNGGKQSSELHSHASSFSTGG